MRKLRDVTHEKTNHFLRERTATSSHCNGVIRCTEIYSILSGSTDFRVHADLT